MNPEFDPSQLDEMLQNQQDPSQLLDQLQLNQEQQPDPSELLDSETIQQLQGEQYIDPEQVQQAILQNMLNLLERQDLNVDVQAKTTLTYAQAYNTLVQAVPQQQVPPEAQFQLEVMKHQHDMQMKEREMALKEQQAQHDMQLKQQELEHRLALASAEKQHQMELQQQEAQQKALNAEHDRLLKQEQLSQQLEMQKQQASQRS